MDDSDNNNNNSTSQQDGRETTNSTMEQVADNNKSQLEQTSTEVVEEQVKQSSNDYYTFDESKFDQTSTTDALITESTAPTRVAEPDIRLDYGIPDQHQPNLLENDNREILTSNMKQLRNWTIMNRLGGNTPFDYTNIKSYSAAFRRSMDLTKAPIYFALNTHN